MQLFAVEASPAPGNVHGCVGDEVGPGDVEGVGEDRADESAEGEAEGTCYYYHGYRDLSC